MARRLIRIVRAWRWYRDTRLWTFVIATLLTLAGAWILKWPCVGGDWGGDAQVQYRRLCYNDIQPLYYVRSFDRDVVPYIGDGTTNPDSGSTPAGFIEYPVLTGLLMYAAALLSDSGDEFMVWNSIFLAAAALLVTLFLYYASGPDKRRVAYWAAAPPLILYAFHNWDLLAVLFATAGLFFYARGRFIASGVACALGASAKLYPILFLPVLGIALLRRERGLGPDGWRFGLGAVGALIWANAPFLILNPRLWLMTYTFHAKRVPNFETLWYVLKEYAERWHLTWMAQAVAVHTLEVATVLAFLALLTTLCVLVWKQRIPPIPAAFGAMLLFMLLNKIYSVQYTLWVMPFFALLHLPWRKYVMLVIGDTVAYTAVFTFFLHFADGRAAEYYNYVAIGVLLRSAALVWLLIGVFRHTSTPRSASIPFLPTSASAQPIASPRPAPATRPPQPRT